jgi:exopolysaccharide biosynthesis polyprenyl glycosylphosphotransferase
MMAVRVEQPLSWVRPWSARQTRARVRLVHQRALLAAVDLASLSIVLFAFGRTGWRGGAFAVLALIVMVSRGHHHPRLVPSLYKDAGSLLGGMALPLVGVLLVAGDLPHQRFLRFGLMAMGAVLLGRLCSYAALRGLRAHGQIVEPTLILGAGTVGVELANVLRDHPEFGLVPVGFLDGFDDTDLPLPIVGDVGSLERVLTEYRVRRVIIAFGQMREPDMVPVLRACDRQQVDIHVLPRFFELGVSPSGAETDDLWGIPVIRMRRAALRTVAWRTKRVFDLAVAGAVAALLSPLLAVLAIMVKLSSPGPVFFRQRRVGQSGRVVDVLKFRSMHTNTDSETKWSVIGDARTTWIGRLMRKTSLDELPQLFNVLRGDMSLVGPRPERPFFVNRFGDEVSGYHDRHRVPSGMTGWAQVHGLRGDTSIEERARFDNQYIENWSLWRDIVILARTCLEVVRGTPT